jgi:hypothetical protein
MEEFDWKWLNEVEGQIPYQVEVPNEYSALETAGVQ